MAQDNNTITIYGVIDGVVFYSEESDYAVLDIECDDGYLITAVGSIPLPREGERVTLTGKWTYHKEFGKQLSVEKYEKTLPVGADEIYKYLASQTVRGIGPKTARKIVDRFGEDTFEVLSNHPEWLADISGITMRKAAEISEAFREQNAMLGVVMFCRDFMDISQACKVYKRFGPAAVGHLRENPYILCEGPSPLPFTKADEIASSIGFDMYYPKRVEHGLKYILNRHASANGHTALHISELLANAAELLCIESDYIKECLDLFLKEGSFRRFKIDDEIFIQTDFLAECEDNIARLLLMLDAGAISYGGEDVGALISGLEGRLGITYGTAQRRAIAEALFGGVLLLTGGPGTGKTTVVKALLSIFDSMGLKCVLCAPTGRAAKRMSEATSHEAMTVHRLLDAERDEKSGEIIFGRGKNNPIEKNVIIVDEASMLDVPLTSALLCAIKRGSRLILIGDKDQLPSVGAGNVLGDLISSHLIRTVTLDEIFRQSGQSLIVTNAHRINKGQMPDLTHADRDFFFIRRDRESDIAETVCDLITSRLPKRYGKSISEGIQTVTPSRQGVAGVLALNTALQARLNPPSRQKRELSAHGTLFREGDKIMQTQNNYDLEWTRGDDEGHGVFNGDIGKIIRIDREEKLLYADFDGRNIKYPFDTLDELELAYAITVHKSQGSEYPVVIVPIYSCPIMLRSRNLLYTAVTRAKGMVILVGRAELLPAWVENNREAVRFTTLKHRLLLRA